MGIPLQIAEPTGRYQRQLRRFVFTSKEHCPDRGYHDAVTDLGEITESEHEHIHGDTWPHDDPRWPEKCGCGYQFKETDEWQRNDNAIYRLPDGTEFAWFGDPGKVAPVGAMIRCEWADRLNPDRGESWMVILPDGGTWMTTQKSTRGEYWTVTGTPPMIDVSPSIFHNQPKGWHGFIRNGELIQV